MPIWDRPYMQAPPPQQSLRVRMRAWSATKWLIVINIAAFVVQAMFGGTPLGGLIYEWLFIHPAKVVKLGYVWQPLTGAFLHGGFWHLLWNMLFLWWFGGELERIFGKKDFLAFYLQACYVGGLAYALGAYFYTGPDVVQDPFTGQLALDYRSAIGASSGVMGVVVLYAFFYPHHRILVYFIIPVKIWVVALLFVIVDVHGFASRSSGGVASAAHLGGAAIGALYWFFDLRWSTLTSRLRRLIGLPSASRKAPRPTRQGFRVVRDHPNVGPVIDVEPDPTPSAVTDADRRRMDRLLERIASDGIDSLSPEEKTFLADMSRKLRHR